VDANKEMTMAYEISYSDGRMVTGIETYEAAIEAVRTQYPEAEIGHDGDLEGGGDRTLCWASEEDSIDDDGARAIASIRSRD
jgi:hypothetical protein